MPATPQAIPFTEEDFEDRLSYADLEDGDHLATLIDVEDARATTGNYGWRFKFDVRGLQLTTTVWLKGGGAWKVREVFNALGDPIAPGERVETLNPNPLIGRTCVVTVKREPASNGATYDDGTVKEFVNIKKHTPYVAEAALSLDEISYGGTE